MRALKDTGLDSTHSVVQEEHDGGEPPCPPLVPKDHLANITYVADLWMAHTEFPSNQRADGDVRKRGMA